MTITKTVAIGRNILPQSVESKAMGRKATTVVRTPKVMGTAMRLRFGRRKCCEHARQAQRFVAQRRAHPVVAARGGITFVEDEVNHFEHGSQALAQLLERWQLGWDRE